MTKITNMTYRYTFSQNVVSELESFSTIHKYDSRHDFKDAWQKWIDHNESLINCEYERLNELGYKGDIKDKLFKSARYYFRKKSSNNTKPKKRRKYISLDKEVLELIDEHIEDQMYLDDTVKPSESYDDFVKEYTRIILTDEISRLVKENNEITTEDAEEKIKKTYKNRYFNYSKKG